MLVDLSFQNFGPFCDRAVFSMESARIEDIEEGLLRIAVLPVPILATSSLFGANASGKSCLVRVLDALQFMVRDRLPEGARYPWYEPNRNSNLPVWIGIRFVREGTLYDYRISYTANRIEFESLTYYPTSRPVSVFIRSGGEFVFRNREASKGLKEAERKCTGNTAFLGWAADAGNRMCSEAFRGISEDIVIHRDEGLKELSAHMRESISFRNHVSRAMGIIGITEADMNASMNVSSTGYPGGTVSSATVRFLSLMGDVGATIQQGKTLVADDFGEGLQTEISKWIVRSFCSESNVSGAQLLFATNDRSLLDSDLLRRDQIWFSDKDPDTGNSSLVHVSDVLGIRAHSDLQKLYSEGRFGHVPVLPKNLF